MRMLPFLLGLALASPALAGPVVVTDIGPVESLAAQVMGKTGAPEMLVEGDAHELQLRPSQIRALDQAAAIFWIGPLLTPGLESAVSGSKAVKVEFDDPANGLTLRAPSQYEGTDPHLWTDPENGKKMIALIAQTLAEVDPANATTYRTNAEAATGQLDEIVAAATRRLAPYKGAKLVVGHDALANFAGRFGLDVVGALSDPSNEDPSAARVAQMHRLIEQGGVDCVLGQPGEAERAAEQLAADTGTPYGRIDPEGAEIPPGPGLYGAMIDGLSQSIADCLAKGKS